MQRSETSWPLWTCYCYEVTTSQLCWVLWVLTVLEHSLVGESQANGRAERAVRTFVELVHKLALETRIGEPNSVQHAVFPLLIEFATTVVNRHLVGKDGVTAFERMKHKLHKKSQGVAPFGCQVMLRVSGKVAGGVLGERWFPGIWPASQASSGEHLVAINSDGKLCHDSVALQRVSRTTRA